MTVTMSSKPLPPDGADHKKGPNIVVRAYLVLFNLLSAFGWATVFYYTVQHLSRPLTTYERLTTSVPSFTPPSLVPVYVRATSTYAAVGQHTQYVQSVAMLEVLHALVGFVRSPVQTTATQVASRLYLVWAIAPRFASAQASPFYASMVLSWSFTEVIRYTFYALSLVGSEPRPLLWLRYTTFYLLYITGASSEAFVCLATLPLRKPLGSWDVESWGRAALFLIWWPGLYVMYAYMIKQRRKVLGGGTKNKAKAKTS
ncbi:PTPLA-domain-containing protein [Amylostereum chailletii]|nr:PTPLA-domain-containing protein [Amylostereum chailletii]